jgi:coenzyme Q-binding protein COQ10
MAVFEARRRVAVPPDVAFAVAADVGSYSQFLPLLQRSCVLGEKTPGQHGEMFKAELAVSYPRLGVAGAFTSTVRIDRSLRVVRASSQDTPFRSIETVWKISEANAGCDVAIRIDYTFRNPLLQIATAAAMPSAIEKVMAAFEARARELHNASITSSSA